MTLSKYVIGGITGFLLGYFLGVNAAIGIVSDAFGYPQEEVREQIRWYTGNDYQ